MLAAFATTILFSISAVCGRRAATLLGGTQANFWRLCFATVLLGIYAHLFGPGLTGAALGIFLVSGCIGFGVGDMALFQALPRIGSRLSVMLVLCLSAPMAAALEWFWLGTPLSRAEIACALVILAGVAVALTPSRGSPSGELHEPGPSRAVPVRRGGWLPVPHAFVIGVLFGIVAAICQAYGAVLSRKAFAMAELAGDNIDGITAAYQRILGGVLLTGIFMLLMHWKHLQVGIRAFPFGGTTDTSPSPVGGVDASAPSSSAASHTNPLSIRERWRQAWALVLLNGLSGPALGVSCYQWALKTTGTGLVLPVVALTPIVIIPFSRFLEGERPTRRSLIGGAVAVLGAILLAVASSSR